MVQTNKSKMHLEINNDVELEMNNLTVSKRNKNAKAPQVSLKSKPRMKRSNLGAKSGLSRSKKLKRTAQTSSLESSKKKGAKMFSTAKKGKRISAEKSSGARLHPAHPKNWRQGSAAAKLAAKAPRKEQSKSLKSKPGSSKVLKQAKIRNAAREEAEKSSKIKSVSGPIDKVKELWTKLTSSSEADKNPAADAESETKSIQIKVIARKETDDGSSATTSNSAAPQRENEGSLVDDESVSASDESKIIFMPIQQTSNGKTAEAMDEDSEKKDVDVKDVKIIEQ